MTQTLKMGLTDEELAAAPCPFRPGLLAGKTAAISGGGGGLGRAMAWQFAKLGASLAICGRDAERLDNTASALRKAGYRVESMICNIRRPDEVESFFAAVVDRLGGMDFLINSAGGQFPQAAIDFTPKGWNAVIETNLTGTWYMMQRAARYWRDTQRPGAITNIVTVTDKGMPGLAHSCAARAGVIALTKTVAVEWAPFRIRVNCIAPGAIDTEGQRVYSEAARRLSARSNPMLRFGDAFDIADAAIFLSAETAKFITGETMTIDGGGRLWGEFWASERPAYFET